MADVERDPDEPDDWCATCGTPLPIDAYWGRRMYCSPSCASKGQGRAPLVGRSCRCCDAPLDPGKRADALYCDDCKVRDRTPKSLRRARTCLHCGVSITHRAADALYCSNRCMIAYARAADAAERKGGRTCQECGGPIPIERQAGAKFCCKRCMWQEQNRRRRRAR